MTDELEREDRNQSLHIRSMADIADAIARGLEEGALLLADANLAEDFFDLRTGLAGELFQKCVNYQTPLAIVISDAKKHGDRFSELVHEHRRHPIVRFFPSVLEGREWLEAKKAEVSGRHVSSRY